MNKIEETHRPHIPVLFDEIIGAIQARAGGTYIDLTLGAGGHASGILEASQPNSHLLGMDVDPTALAIATKKLAVYGARVKLLNCSYVHLAEELAKLNWPRADGIVLDLGASSMQFDTATRGFSFYQDGPLDMRFDPSGSLTADEIVNQWETEAIAEILYLYGEEPRSRQIAREITARRPIKSTQQLAQLISQAVRYPDKSRVHPATRSFQALRIAVNGELDALQKVLPQAIEALAPGGRFAVLSFHSLEDRIVKHFFKAESRDRYDESQMPPQLVQRARIGLVNRKPISASAKEVLQNPRARSAKLRIVERKSE